MKVKGKIRDLKSVLARGSCDGFLDPMVLLMYEEEDRVDVRLRDDDDMVMVVSKFNTLEIEESEEGEELVVDGQKLLEHLAVVPSKSDFVLTKEEGLIKIVTDQETVNFSLDEDWEGNVVEKDNVPVRTEDGDKYVSSAKMTVEAEMSARGISKIIKRMDVVDVTYIELLIENDELTSLIGKIQRDRDNPHKFTPKAEIRKCEGDESVELSYGIKEVTKVLNGEIEVYFGDNKPIIFYDEGENYKATYILSPLVNEEQRQG